ncbi:MAG: SDR family NAD(P)-dependent oxidoreductase [Acidobacteriota bacterium]
MTDARTWQRLLEQASRRIESLEAEIESTRAPVAVVGMGCRLPGVDPSSGTPTNLGDPDAFWRLLERGDHTVREVPAERWPLDLAADPAVRFGSFLEQVDRFDADLFGIAPREARALDPQQRLLLEVARETFEDAGLPPRAVPARTGVFLGLSNVDYREAMAAEADPLSLDGYFSSGATASTASGRVSYVFGLEGPCVSVDTACSSSLVAVHLALAALRRGECDLALAGGVHLMLTPAEATSLARARMLAPDGRCKPFSAAADGYVRAEGCGLVLLERDRDARRRSARRQAMVRGSAVGQDGRSSGMTVPNGPAQQDVMRAALRDAGAKPDEIGYVEAHGTGTALGDPIEAGALGTVFSGRDEAPEPRALRVGSVKSNLGHCESAAGIAGLLKAVLVLRERAIPPTLHLAEPNPRIDWPHLPLRVPTTLEPWTASRRLAGVSSFGFSGTNCHVVLEAVDEDVAGSSEAVKASARIDRPLHVLPLSARSPDLLERLTARWNESLETSAAPFADLCHTAAVGRDAAEHRLALVAADADAAHSALRGGRAVTGRAPEHRQPPRVAFLCTGQGAQSPNMARELAATEPSVLRDLEHCAEILRAHEVDLVALLSLSGGEDVDSTVLDRTENAQPALVAVGWALARLWRRWGIEPSAVAGHSLGEITAACLAGILTLEDALALAAARGRLLQRVDGAMVALRTDAATVERALGALAHDDATRVALAAFNGPRDVVLSGPRDVVDQLITQLQADGIAGTRLPGAHAFHSPLVEPILDDFAAVVRGLSFTAPTLPFVSALNGTLYSPGVDPPSPEHWVEHVRSPVCWADALATLAGVDGSGIDAYLEIGPKPQLLPTVGARDVLRLPSLRPGRAWPTLLRSLATLWTHGAPVDWRAVDADHPRRLRRAPTTPFERQRYWFRDAPGVPGLGARRSVATYQGSTKVAGSDARSMARTTTRAWLHEIAWRPVELGSPTASSPESRVVALDAASEALAAQVAEVLELPGSARHGSQSTANAATAADRLLLVADRSPSQSPERLDALCGALLEVLQARVAARSARAAPVRLLCRGAVQTSADEPPADPAVAGLRALARTAASEHPEHGWMCLDLHDGELAAAHLHAALAHDEPRMALRGHRLLAPRLVASPETGQAFEAVDSAAVDSAPVDFTNDEDSAAVVLILGGVGGLGLRVAGALAARATSSLHLVLVGRRARSADEAEALRARLDRQGVTVHLSATEVSDADAVARLLDDCRGRGRLRAVVHAAGILDDGPLVRQTSARLRGVLAPRIHAAVALERALEACGGGLETVPIVAFTSLAGVVDTAATGGYGAANAALDAWAAARQARGAPTLAIAWGPWASIGLSAGDEDANARLGLRSLDADAAAELTADLLHALDDPAASLPSHRVAVDADWPRYRASLPAAAGRLLDELTPAVGPTEHSADAEPRPDARADLLASPYPRRALRGLVDRELRAVLGRDRPIDPRTGFFDLGMDSLMATDLVHALDAALALQLPATLALTRPSLDELVDELARRLSLEPSAPGTSPNTPQDTTDTATPAETAHEDSTAELLARLDATLRRHGGSS